MKKVFEKFLAKLALQAAFSAHGAASQWNAYQPTEPECLRNLNH